jgi:hypothetical protein
MAPDVATYEARDPSRTILYKVIAEHLETFLASLDADPAAKGLPAYVQREFYDYLQCGILAHSRGYAPLEVRIKKGIDSRLGGENLCLSHCGYISWPCCILPT